MEPLRLDGLPEQALLLMDSVPIIYVLEGHPILGRRFRPIFEAHAAGRLRFAMTTIIVAEILTGPLQAPKTRWRAATAPSSDPGSSSRSTSTLRKALRDCGLRSASSWQTRFRQRAPSRSTLPSS
jgi:hypothetical protein